MLTGLYSAATAMEASSRQHEVISRNLAHAQMPGYRRQTIRHGTFESQFDDEVQQIYSRPALGTDASDLRTDFTAGTYERTDRQFDVAIQGEGFFVVEGPQGPLYTRNGSFQLDDRGRLVTADGLPVQGQGGEITIPAEVTHDTVRIEPDGTVHSGDNVFGQLRVVRFENPQTLQPAGVTLFSAPDDVRETPADAVLLQGTRERANVHPIQELVDLIAAQRRHEAAQRSMKMITDAIERHTHQTNF